MTKDELICVTLEQFEMSLKVMPECLKLEDPSIAPTRESLPGPAIIWRHLIEVDGRNIPDPNNASRTVIVTYNRLSQELICHIYFREVMTTYNAISPDAKIELKLKYPSLNKSYRKFMRLRSKLIKRANEQERSHFLDKLNSIFPTAFTDDLLK